MVEINKRLNLVLKIELPPIEVYVHSTPISRDVFDAYWNTIARSFTKLFATPLLNVSGPKVAKNVIRDEAMSLGVWDEVPGGNARGVKNGLFGEIRRLSNVVMPIDGGGWTSVPLEVAISQKKFDEDDIVDIENRLAFFIVISAIRDKREMAVTMAALAEAWPTMQSTSLNATEYAAFLATSTKDDVTEPKAAA